MNDHARWLATSSEVPLERWDSGQSVAALDSVAEETPLALIYNGLQHVVMMASPADLEDFALGFSLSEAVIATPAQLHAVETDRVADGVAVYMDIDAARAHALETQRRNLAGRTGCGLCGAETIEQAVRHPAPVASGVRITAGALQDALARLAQRQQLNARTGSVHAAAWATPEGEVVVVREDVGRHNALDKMIGAVAREGRPFGHGFALITSRASFEMAQKAATVGITLLAAISAPTGLAIRLAQETGLTLIGFARGRSFNVYANPQRVGAA